MLCSAEVQRGDGLQDLDELEVALLDGVAELVGVHVDVLEEALEVTLRGRADGRGLDVLEGVLQGGVQVRVEAGHLADVREELGGLDEDALLLDDLVGGEHGFLVFEVLVAEGRVPRVVHPLVDVGGHVLADVAVEQGA